MEFMLQNYFILKGWASTHTHTYKHTHSTSDKIGAHVEWIKGHNFPSDDYVVDGKPKATQLPAKIDVTIAKICGWKSYLSAVQDTINLV